jgi:hypothetical protein
MQPTAVNGGPGALLLDGEQRVVAVLAFELLAGEIKRISSIVNPDKLGHLGAVSDLGTLLARRRPSREGRL